MTDIFNFSLNELEIYFKNLNENPAKAKILYRELSNGLIDFNNLNSIKASLREKLSQDFSINIPVCVKESSSENVVKLLFSLSDNNLIESVLMRQKYGNSVCISTQIGCNMGCSFCESGKQKRIRNLTSGEMVSQLMYIKNVLGEEIKTVTIMGIGEPFDNYDNVIKFIDIITSPYGLSVGVHHVTVSTCGLVPKIEQYTQRKVTNNLAISLHAPNDALRNKLMPINNRYSIDELLKSLKEYTIKKKRKIFVEYVMIEAVNDSEEHAKELALLLKDLKCTVNLIPFNETNSMGYNRTTFEQMMKFYHVLKSHNVHATVRREIGCDIDAACGQLRSKYNK